MSMKYSADEMHKVYEGEKGDLHETQAQQVAFQRKLAERLEEFGRQYPQKAEEAQAAAAGARKRADFLEGLSPQEWQENLELPEKLTARLVENLRANIRKHHVHDQERRAGRKARK